jgi:basic membrane lipoprotein Med (substrate-binding protein (PBP1-ABC) superfamily)
MLRRTILASSLLLPSLLISSCSHRSSESATGSLPAGAPAATLGAEQQPGAVRKVGLLVTGPVSDGGWNEIAWKGCQQIKQKFGAEINNQLVTKPEQFETSFRGYAQDGYDLVFGHGAEFSDAALRVGPQFPKSHLVVTGGTAQGENVSHIKLAMEEGTYLLGLLAGSMTNSGRLGQIGGTPLEPVKQAFAAFERGVHAVKPSAKVITTYVGNWNDANAGKEQALALIRQGCDFLLPNADAAGNGVFQAVQENKSKGVMAFGANSDQTSMAPDVILASAVLDVPRAFVLVAQSIQDDKFDGKPYVFGMKEQVVSVVYNPALAPRVPVDVRKRVDTARSNILAGKLKLVQEGM